MSLSKINVSGIFLVTKTEIVEQENPYLRLFISGLFYDKDSRKYTNKGFGIVKVYGKEKDFINNSHAFKENGGKNIEIYLSAIGMVSYDGQFEGYTNSISIHRNPNKIFNNRNEESKQGPLNESY